MADLSDLVGVLRAHPGLRAKQDLHDVASIIGGNGDDAATLSLPGADGVAVVGAEAILPALVRADPYVAGIAGVVTALNDLAATGGRPLGILDTVIGDRALVHDVLRGLRAGADRYGVPIVGGHTTIDPRAAALSTFALGWAPRAPAPDAAGPGDRVVLLTCLEGRLVGGPDGAGFFTHLRGPRGEAPGADLALVPDLIASGAVRAARDVSMPGIVGSLVQMLDTPRRVGAVVDLGAIPVPPGVDVGTWLTAFPSFGFLLVGDPPAIARAAGDRGLTAAEIATLDDTGVVRLVDGPAEAVVWDLGAEPLTGFGQAGRVP